MPTKVGTLQKWWTRISRFEFWPFTLFYLPVFGYYGCLALRSRSLFFFTASNPSIEFGGMMGEKKSDIFDLIPPEYIPVTKLFKAGTSAEELHKYLEGAGLQYPFILKPDMGDRGWMVEKISTDEQLRKYLATIEVDFLVQEFVGEPIEVGVFYVRMPGEKRGRITSVVRKGFLSIRGDGQHTVQELLEQNVRAVLQADMSSPAVQSIAANVPRKGEEIEIESIGNHCRGTTFFDAGDWIDDALTITFDEVADQIEEFYFGRFDIRCRSIEDLRKGEHFKILELNGAGAEPGHIYQPGYSLIQAYKDVTWHLKLLFEVSRANRRRGHKYWKFSDGWNKLQEVRTYNKARTT